MTMLETRKAIENALYCGNPLPFDAMMNCYVAVQNYLANCEKDKDIKYEAKVRDMDNICDYDEAYSRHEAWEIGWCNKCKNVKCPYKNKK